MSASWDEDREGSALGVDEFQRNLDNVKEGLGRSRENAILRDRLQSGQVRMEDVQKKPKSPKPATLSEKMQQDGLDWSERTERRRFVVNAEWACKIIASMRMLSDRWKW